MANKSLLPKDPDILAPPCSSARPIEAGYSNFDGVVYAARGFDAFAVHGPVRIKDFEKKVKEKRAKEHPLTMSVVEASPPPPPPPDLTSTPPPPPDDGIEPPKPDEILGGLMITHEMFPDSLLCLHTVVLTQEYPTQPNSRGDLRPPSYRAAKLVGNQAWIQHVVLERRTGPLRTYISSFCRGFASALSKYPAIPIPSNPTSGFLELVNDACGDPRYDVFDHIPNLTAVCAVETFTLTPKERALMVPRILSRNMVFNVPGDLLVNIVSGTQTALAIYFEYKRLGSSTGFLDQSLVRPRGLDGGPRV